MNQKRPWGTSLSLGLAVIPLLIALVLRLFVIIHYGPYVSIHSDDMGYLRSAEWFLQSGTYSYYTPDKPTVHMLPGMTFLLAAVIGPFGHGAIGLTIAKVLFSVIGVVGILGAYQSVKYVWNQWAACLVALFLAVYIPGIETDTLFLTEPPFMATFAWTIYFVLRAADSHRLRHVVAASFLFVACIYFRPNILLWLVVVLIYFIVKRYPWKKLVGHCVVVTGIIILCLLPWWIRNEIVFHQFIALTDDAANPLLLGTFQGVHTLPPSNPTDVEYQILHAHPDLKPQAEHEIPWFKAQQHEAMWRIRRWHHLDPQAFWQSYLWIKPGILWQRAYYPIRMLGMLPHTMKVIQPWILWISLIGHGVSLIFGRGKRRETLFILGTLLYFTVLFSIFFAYERYNVPIMWLMFSGIPTGIYALVALIWRLVQRKKRVSDM